MEAQAPRIASGSHDDTTGRRDNKMANLPARDRGLRPDSPPDYNRPR
jgi:hypothetical protein